MKRELSILLASHGHFANEALNSLEMIMGEQKNIESVSLELGEDLNGFYKTMEEAYLKLNHTEGVIVICDILGGTPSNATKMLLAKYSNENIVAYAGLNLGILLEITSNRQNGFENTVSVIEDSSYHIWQELEAPDIDENNNEKIEELDL